MDVPPTAGGARDPTRSATPSPLVHACMPGALSETPSVEGALRECMRLAALGAEVGVALTQAGAVCTPAVDAAVIMKPLAIRDFSLLIRQVLDQSQKE